MDDRKLIQLAREALPFAYAPYSGYRVGAALLAEDGRIYTGVNIENASYGLTICAERAALAGAVSAGCRSFSAIAVVSADENVPLPCGACRQVLREFAGDDFRVIAAGKGEKALTFLLSELQPHTFVFPKGKSSQEK